MHDFANKSDANNKIFYFIVVLAICVPLSRIAWYDYKGIAIASGSEPIFLRTIFYIFAVLLLPVFFWGVVKLFFSKSVGKMPFLFMILALYGAGVGLLNQNNINYIAGDTYKLLVFAFGFSIGKLFFLSEKKERVLNFALLAGFLFLIFRFFSFYFNYSSRVGFVYGTVQDLFYIFLVFALFLRRGGAGMLILFSVSLLMIVVGQKRSVLGLAVLLVPVIPFVIMRINYKNLALSYVVVIFFVFMSAIFVSSELGENVGEKYFKRIVSTDWSEKVELQDGRASESEAIFEEMASSPGWNYLFGNGSGAEFEKMSQREGRFVDVHSVHITPLAMYFRYGFFGLILYVFVFVLALRLAASLVFNRRHFKGDAVSAIFACYGLASAGCSLVVFGFVDDILASLSMGYVYMALKVKGENLVSKEYTSV